MRSPTGEGRLLLVPPIRVNSDRDGRRGVNGDREIELSVGLAVVGVGSSWHQQRKIEFPIQYHYRCLATSAVPGPFVNGNPGWGKFPQ